MKFSCEKALLQAAISTTSRATSPKSTIPALEGILLEAGGELRFTGYNLETGIQTMVPAEIQEKGSLVLSARKFADVVGQLPDDTVTVTTDALTVHIQCGATEYNIPAIDAEEFPELPEVESQSVLTLSRRLLSDMIGRTIFAVATNDGRPILTGSLFEVTGGQLNVVSVDGQRLALRREKLEKAPAADLSFVVPGSALKEVRTICGDGEEEVSILIGTRHILFRLENTQLVTRRLEGEFLNYRQSISWKSDIRLVADVRQLMTSISRASVILKENSKNPLRCIVGEGELYLSSVTAADGNSYDVCPVEGSGSDLHIGFNHRFMMDALKAVPTEKAKLLMGTPSTPCIIVPVEEPEGEESFLFMVLPVRMSATWDK